MDLIQTLVAKTWLGWDIVRNIIALIEEWNTIPFIARYRKEATMWATDTQLRDFEDIYQYHLSLWQKKTDVIRLLTEKGVITDELRQAVEDAMTMTALDDIYRPYKDKKNTRASRAIAAGLQPLADLLLACETSLVAFTQEAENYLVSSLRTDQKDSSPQGVETIDDAIQWAQDIVAEVVADDTTLRTIIKNTQARSALLTTKKAKGYQENSTYKNYADYHKTLSQMPSYAYLAIARAEKEKELSVSVQFDHDRANSAAKRQFVPSNASDLLSLLDDAIQDGIKRLLLPSLERELRKNKKEQSDREAIEIFGHNVKELLLSSPVKDKVMMGFDPAYRTWCKLAIIDKTWHFVTSEVIYPTKPQQDLAWARQTMVDLITTHGVELICIGNGTASRESELFVADCLKQHDLSCKYLVVSESGASVYSASKLANQEYPDLDVTVRGAINIAQRVQDPLATYVKIDPKALWVGQYQHDVDQKLLKEKLDNNIQDAVNAVGVDINTASWPLLQYIAWLTTKTAQNIVAYRQEIWMLTKRSQIKKIAWIWPKAFEQCAWFLRITDSREPLDQTGIHPESYALTYDILDKECGITNKNLVVPFVFPADKDLSDIAQRYDCGKQTLTDIIRELANPGLDPREEFDEKGFRSDVLSLEDLYEWLALTGVVRNITDFGAFVDIWLKNDGLVHISEMSTQRLSSPFDAVSLGQAVTVTVIGVDKDRQRVSLSMKRA